MKTQIIQLEIHDDIISTRDKMEWGKSSRVLLVWPDRGRLLTRRLDLVLLKRHSARLGAQLALVTRDPEVCAHAQKMGIPVFAKLRKAQSSHWKTSRRLSLPGGPKEEPGERRPVLTRPDLEEKSLPALARLAIFTLAVLAFLSIAAVLMPSAEVQLAPRTEIQEITIEVQPRTEVSEIQLSGLVPARQVSVVVEGRESMPASGTAYLPDRTASGQAVFTNLTDQAITIPVGNVIRTITSTPIRFATTEAGNLTAEPGSNITISIQALVPGSQGNLPAESLVGIEGQIGTQLKVSNTQPTSGGKDRQSPAASAGDRQKLKERLFLALQDTARQELQNIIGSGGILLTDTPVLSQTLEEVFEPAEDEPTDLLNLHLRLEFRALAGMSEDLNSLAEAVLNANLPQGYVPVPATLKIEANRRTGSNAQDLDQWDLHTQRQIQAQVSRSEAVRLTLGLSPEQAREQLMETLKLDEPPRIVLIPAWWPRLPVLPFRIHISEQIGGAWVGQN